MKNDKIRILKWLNQGLFIRAVDNRMDNQFVASFIIDDLLTENLIEKFTIKDFTFYRISEVGKSFLAAESVASK